MTGPLHGARKLYTDLRFVYDQWTRDPFEELFKQLIEMPNPPFEIDHAFLELHYPGECLVDDQAVHFRPKRHLVKESLLTRLFIQLDHLLLDSSGDDHFGRVLHSTKATQVTRIVGHAGVKVGQNRLFALLDERYGWIKRAVGDGRYRVIQSAIESGYMSVIPQSHYHPKTGVLVLDAPQPRVTPKGVQRILVDHGGAA